MNDLFEELAARHGTLPSTDPAAQDAAAVSRRGVLRAALAGGGIFWLGAVPQAQAQNAPAVAVGAGGPNILNPEAYNAMAWLRIEADNSIRVMVAKSEMGQGVLTALPMILADELEADWATVKPEHAPLGRAFDDPRANARDTGGSRSIRLSYELMRTLGASAREMLVTAAAARWGVPEADCVARDSHVLHPPTQRRVAYAALAADAARLPVPAKPRLKDPRDFKLIGKSLPRVDVPQKVNGQAVYAIDITMPRMLVATVIHSPVFGGELEAVDDREARALPGFHSVVRSREWVAVLASGFWPARQAAQALKITWRDGAFAAMNQARISEQFARAADAAGARVRTEGGCGTGSGPSRGTRHVACRCDL
jgi:isoquinoline 1-oxidoreductase subunit beta